LYVLFEIASLGWKRQYMFILTICVRKLSRLYLLVPRIERFLLHRHPSSIILREAFLLVFHRTLEELFTLFLSFSVLSFGSKLEYIYQVKHVFDSGRRHGRSCVVLDKHKAIVGCSIEELCRSMRIRWRYVDDRDLC